MDPSRISDLLAPYLEGESLSSTQLDQVSTYLDLLLKWNARMNLTSVRDPEQILQRHFGESFFTARKLFSTSSDAFSLADVGSGAGFPGVPIALLRPNVQVKLIESHGKKATFLKEIARNLALTNLEVLPIRAENCHLLTNVVTLRAVEHFADVLPIAARLVAPGGRLAALLGSTQVEQYKPLIPESWSADPPVNYPGSSHRVLWILHRSN